MKQLPPTHPGIKLGSPLPISCFRQRSSTILFSEQTRIKIIILSRIEEGNGASSKLKVQRMRYTKKRLQFPFLEPKFVVEITHVNTENTENSTQRSQKV